MSLDESVTDRENLTTIEAVTDQINAQVADIISWLKTCKDIEFLKFEKQLSDDSTLDFRAHFGL